MLDISMFERFSEFVNLLSEEEQVRISDALTALRKRDFDALYIKEIDGPIREVRIGKYRILFCIEYSTVFVFTGFIKKTWKTPKDEKEVAQKLYRLLLKEINQQ